MLVGLLNTATDVLIVQEIQIQTTFRQDSENFQPANPGACGKEQSPVGTCTVNPILPKV